MNGQPNWLTVPVDRSFHGTKLINEMLINNKTDWRDKMLKSIRQNYIKAPYFKEIMPLVESLINESTENLAGYNIKAIRMLTEQMGMSTDHFILASTIDTEGSSNELLISITKKAGGDTYMCGGGAGGYQDDQIFKQSGIVLHYQEFEHPKYEQLSSTEFVPGLSIIDALMNVGWIELQRRLKITR